MSTSGPPGGPYPAGEPQDPWPGGERYDPYSNPSDPFGIAAAWGTPPQPPQQHDEQPTEPYGQPQPPEPYGQPHGHPQQPDYLQQPQFLQPPAPYGEPAVHSQPTGFDQPTQYLQTTQYVQPPRPRPEQYAQPRPEQYAQPPVHTQQPGPTVEDTWGGPAAPERPRARRSRLVFAVVAGLVVVLAGAIGTGAYLAAHRDASTDTFRSTRAAQPVPASASPQAQSSPSAGASDSTDVGNDAIIAQPGECLINDGTNEAPKLRKVACAKDTYEVLKRFPGTIDKKKCDGVPGYTHNYFFDSSVDSEDFVLCLKQQK